MNILRPLASLALAHCIVAPCFVSTVRANIVTFTFGGNLNGPYSGTVGGPAFGSIPLNAPFSGTLVYDDSTPWTTSNSNNFVYFPTASLSLTVGSETATTNSVTVLAYHRSLGYPTDLIFFYGRPITGTLGGQSVDALQVVLQNITASVLPVGTLPTSLDLSQFTPGSATFVEIDRLTTGRFGLQSDFLRGDLTSGYVPEPGTAFPLLTLAPLSRRRR